MPPRDVTIIYIMTKIIFESHATSADNENQLASGWNDIDLSELGLEQARAIGERYQDNPPDMVFCSDLQRSYKTAALAFVDQSVPIIVDSRLRECDYGDLTQAPKDKVWAERAQRIEVPFENGESYRETSKRMKEFLDEIRDNFTDETIMIIGHRATQYGLEEHIQGKKLEDIIAEPWTWQPGWIYEL